MEAELKAKNLALLNDCTADKSAISFCQEYHASFKQSAVETEAQLKAKNLALVNELAADKSAISI